MNKPPSIINYQSKPKLSLKLTKLSPKVPLLIGSPIQYQLNTRPHPRSCSSMPPPAPDPRSRPIPPPPRSCSPRPHSPPLSPTCSRLIPYSYAGLELRSPQPDSCIGSGTKSQIDSRSHGRTDGGNDHSVCSPCDHKIASQLPKKKNGLNQFSSDRSNESDKTTGTDCPSAKSSSVPQPTTNGLKNKRKRLGLTSSNRRKKASSNHPSDNHSTNDGDKKHEKMQDEGTDRKRTERTTTCEVLIEQVPNINSPLSNGNSNQVVMLSETRCLSDRHNNQKGNGPDNEDVTVKKKSVQKTSDDLKKTKVASLCHVNNQVRVQRKRKCNDGRRSPSLDSDFKIPHPDNNTNSSRSRSRNDHPIGRLTYSRIPTDAEEEEELQLALAVSASLHQQQDNGDNNQLNNHKTKGTKRSRLRRNVSPPPLLLTSSPEAKRRLMERVHEILDKDEGREVTEDEGIISCTPAMAPSSIGGGSMASLPSINTEEEHNRDTSEEGDTTNERGTANTANSDTEVISTLDDSSEPCNSSPSATERSFVLKGSQSRIGCCSNGASIQPVSNGYKTIWQLSAYSEDEPIQEFFVKMLSDKLNQPQGNNIKCVKCIEDVQTTPPTTNNVLGCQRHDTGVQLHNSKQDHTHDSPSSENNNDIDSISDGDVHIDDEEKELGVTHVNGAITPPLSRRSHHDSVVGAALSGKDNNQKNMRGKGESRPSSHAQLSKDLYSLFQTGLFSDLTVVTADKDTPLTAHKGIVCSRCPSLIPVLTASNDALHVLDLSAFSYEAVRLFLEFVYTDQICSLPNDSKIVDEVIMIAELWEVKELVNFVRTQTLSTRDRDSMNDGEQRDHRMNNDCNSISRTSVGSSIITGTPVPPVTCSMATQVYSMDNSSTQTEHSATISSTTQTAPCKFAKDLQLRNASVQTAIPGNTSLATQTDITRNITSSTQTVNSLSSSFGTQTLPCVFAKDVQVCDAIVQTSTLASSVTTQTSSSCKCGVERHDMITQTSSPSSNSCSIGTQSTASPSSNSCSIGTQSTAPSPPSRIRKLKLKTKRKNVPTISQTSPTISQTSPTISQTPPTVSQSDPACSTVAPRSSIVSSVSGTLSKEGEDPELVVSNESYHHVQHVCTQTVNPTSTCDVYSQTFCLSTHEVTTQTVSISTCDNLTQTVSVSTCQVPTQTVSVSLCDVPTQTEHPGVASVSSQTPSIGRTQLNQTRPSPASSLPVNPPSSSRLVSTPQRIPPLSYLILGPPTMNQAKTPPVSKSSLAISRIQLNNSTSVKSYDDRAMPTSATPASIGPPKPLYSSTPRMPSLVPPTVPTVPICTSLQSNFNKLSPVDHSDQPLILPRTLPNIRPNSEDPTTTDHQIHIPDTMQTSCNTIPMSPCAAGPITIARDGQSPPPTDTQYMDPFEIPSSSLFDTSVPLSDSHTTNSVEEKEQENNTTQCDNETVVNCVSSACSPEYNQPLDNNTSDSVVKDTSLKPHQATPSLDQATPPLDQISNQSLSISTEETNSLSDNEAMDCDVHDDNKGAEIIYLREDNCSPYPQDTAQEIEFPNTSSSYSESVNRSSNIRVVQTTPSVTIDNNSNPNTSPVTVCEKHLVTPVLSRADEEIVNADVSVAMEISVFSDDLDLYHQGKGKFVDKEERFLMYTPFNHRNDSTVLMSGDNITPLPPYRTMATPHLKEACSSYGVRHLPKGKMIAKLEEIYEYTHPLVDKDDNVVCSGKDQPKKQYKKKSFAKKKQKTTSTTGTATGTTGTMTGTTGTTTSATGTSTGTTTSATGTATGITTGTTGTTGISSSTKSKDGPNTNTDSNTGDKDHELKLMESVINVIKKDPLLYQDVVMYKPCELLSIQSKLKDSGVGLSREKLSDLLDKLSITFVSKPLPKPESTNKPSQ